MSVTADGQPRESHPSSAASLAQNSRLTALMPPCTVATVARSMGTWRPTQPALPSSDKSTTLVIEDKGYQAG